jgi:hypothetical protein
MYGGTLAPRSRVAIVRNTFFVRDARSFDTCKKRYENLLV